ncbi:hypothetical protein QEN19_001117 [Hanseniaspora menglaensis]
MSSTAKRISFLEPSADEVDDFVSVSSNNVDYMISSASIIDIKNRLRIYDDIENEKQFKDILLENIEDILKDFNATNLSKSSKASFSNDFFPNLTKLYSKPLRCDQNGIADQSPQLDNLYVEGKCAELIPLKINFPAKSNSSNKEEKRQSFIFTGDSYEKLSDFVNNSSEASDSGSFADLSEVMDISLQTIDHDYSLDYDQMFSNPEYLGFNELNTCFVKQQTANIISESFKTRLVNKKLMKSVPEQKLIEKKVLEEKMTKECVVEDNFLKFNSIKENAAINNDFKEILIEEQLIQEDLLLNDNTDDFIDLDLIQALTDTESSATNASKETFLGLLDLCDHNEKNLFKDIDNDNYNPSLKKNAAPLRSPLRLEASIPFHNHVTQSPLQNKIKNEDDLQTFGFYQPEFLKDESFIEEGFPLLYVKKHVKPANDKIVSSNTVKANDNKSINENIDFFNCDKELSALYHDNKFSYIDYDTDQTGYRDKMMLNNSQIAVKAIHHNFKQHSKMSPFLLSPSKLLNCSKSEDDQSDTKSVVDMLEATCELAQLVINEL